MLIFLAGMGFHGTAQGIRVNWIDSLMHAANVLVAQHGKILYGATIGYAGGSNSVNYVTK